MTQLLCSSLILTHIPQIIQHSGHSFFQYGDYGGCIDTPGFNYNFLDFGLNTADLGYTIGLCLPKQCTTPIIKQILT